MSKLEEAKKFISDHIEDAPCGIFNTRNYIGDEMETVYDHDGLVIDLCRYWEYFEVFGLSDEEFYDLSEFYATACWNRRKAES